MKELKGLYRKWYATHDEAGKTKIREREQKIRSNFGNSIAGDEEICLLTPQQNACRSDLRLLWPQVFSGNRPGFDIVIGNPPYGFAKKSGTNKKMLLEQGFKCTKRLEFLFLELAYNLAKKENGIISQIVPIGISFDRTFQKMRQTFQQNCKEIDLSHFNHNPTSLFQSNPWLSNSKTATHSLIFTAVKRTCEEVEVRTSIPQRFRAEERQAAIEREPGYPLPKELLNDLTMHSQWPRIKDNQTGKIILEAKKNGTSVSTFSNNTSDAKKREPLNIPSFANYHLSVLPNISINRESWKIEISSPETASIVFLALNTYIFNAWWIAYGDLLHVNQSEVHPFPVPKAWLDATRLQPPALKLAKKLENLIRHLQKQTRIHKKTQTAKQNVDFSDDITAKGIPLNASREIIEEASLLYLKAIGIPPRDLQKYLESIKHLSAVKDWQKLNFKE